MHRFERHKPRGALLAQQKRRRNARAPRQVTPSPFTHRPLVNSSKKTSGPVQNSCKPVEVGSLSYYLQGFSTIPGGCFGSLPSACTPFFLGNWIAGFRSFKLIFRRSSDVYWISWDFQGPPRNTWDPLLGPILFPLHPTPMFEEKIWVPLVWVEA